MVKHERRILLAILERVGVFVFSLLMVAGSLGLAVWLVTTGQAAYVDGLFLLLVCFVFAGVFGTCARLVVRAGIEGAAAPAAPKAAETVQRKAA
jgi:hypothetical protein